jgi:hypothetical protein
LHLIPLVITIGFSCTEMEDARTLNGRIQEIMQIKKAVFVQVYQFVFLVMLSYFTRISKKMISKTLHLYQKYDIIYLAVKVYFHVKYSNKMLLPKFYSQTGEKRIERWIKYVKSCRMETRRTQSL